MRISGLATPPLGEHRFSCGSTAHRRYNSYAPFQNCGCQDDGCVPVLFLLRNSVRKCCFTVRGLIWSFTRDLYAAAWTSSFNMLVAARIFISPGQPCFTLWVSLENTKTLSPKVSLLGTEEQLL